MPLFPALLVLTALVAAAVLIGVVWRARDGRRSAGSDAVDLHDLGVTPGRTALVQFSTETCARCPQVRRMLREVASTRPDVDYIDVDLTARPDLARRHHVLTTPTTFLIAADATVTARFTGAPRRGDVDAALDELPTLQVTR